MQESVIKIRSKVRLKIPFTTKIKKNCFWQLAILFLRASRYTRFMRFVLLKRREICKRHNWVSANYDNKNRVCFLQGINKDLSSLLVWWRENLENQCPTPTRPPIVPIFGHWRPLSSSGFLVKVSSHTRAQTLKIKSWLKILLSKYVLVLCHPKIQFWPVTTS